MTDFYDRLSEAGLQISRREAIALERQLSKYSKLVNFPSEVLQDIASRLPYTAIIALCLSNTSFQYKICDDEKFWRVLYIKANLSNRIQGVDFRKAYHAFTTPLFTDDGYPSSGAWSRYARRFINNQYPDRRTREAQRDFFSIMQALDQGWEKRASALIAKYESKFGSYALTRYLHFLLGKGDLNTLKWFVSTYVLIPNASGDSRETELQRLQVMAADSARDIETLNYVFYELGVPVPRAVNEAAYLQHRRSLQDVAAEFGNEVSAGYIFQLYPPTIEDKEELLELAENNPKVLRLIRNLTPIPENQI